MFAENRALTPNDQDKNEQATTARSIELAFESWRPYMLIRACEQIEKVLLPYILPRLDELMANASDSIVMS
jgi:hypothetical protein